VEVFDASGRQIDAIAVPERPANVSFGGKDHRTLFITARTSLYAIALRVKGANATK
jgi:gluconolactonase